MVCSGTGGGGAPALDARIHPRTDASVVLAPGQRAVLWALAAGAAALALWDWFFALCATNLLLSALYFAAFAAKLAFMAKAARRDPRIRVSDAELAAARGEDLPVYTILLPMYHEARIVPALLRALEALDYPAEQLDIKFLLEADDDETRAAADAADTRLACEVVLVPDVGPRTKPRACNEGLARARGEFTVIYDAEDRPDPDQLLKAVAAFRRLPRHVACLQCALDFYNRHQNWLTRQFTIEYAAWFDLFLPGLHAAGLPIPLGGTSNHFRYQPAPLDHLVAHLDRGPRLSGQQRHDDVREEPQRLLAQRFLQRPLHDLDVRILCRDPVQRPKRFHPPARYPLRPPRRVPRVAPRTAG